jgi:Ca2+-binding EF-hand superfamily protein
MVMFVPFSNENGWSRETARDKYLPVCNADGGMSAQHFYKLLGLAGIAENEIDAIMSSIDLKPTGFVGLEEFLDFLGYETEIDVIQCSQTVEWTTTHMAEVMQTDDGKTALREFFDCLDKDGNGKVSANEWCSQLGKKKHSMLKYFCGSTAAEIGHAFKRIDANGDGSLSWDEFVAAAEAKSANVDSTTAKLAAVMQTDNGKGALKEFFDILDKDCNGKVSAKEWCNQLGKKKHALLEYFCGSTPSEIGHAFKRIDANGDGLLSWDEFVAAADKRAMQAA